MTHFSEDAKSGKQIAKEVQWEQNRSFLRKAAADRDELFRVFTCKRDLGYGRTDTAWVNGKARALHLQFTVILFASDTSAVEPIRKTPRLTLSTFSALPVDVTYQEVVRRAGTPDDDVGSGIYVFRYYPPTVRSSW